MYLVNSGKNAFHSTSNRRSNQNLQSSFPLPSESPLGLPDLDHALYRPPADGTDLHLFGAFDTCTDMPALIEQGIRHLSVADRTHFGLLVCDLPIRDAFTPPLAFLVATYVFIACPFLDRDALTVLLVVRPAAGVGITVRIGAGALGVLLACGSGACHKWTGIRVAGCGDVGAKA